MSYSNATCLLDGRPVFIFADCRTGETYVQPAKAGDESTIQLLLSNSQQASVTVFIDGFRADEPLGEYNVFNRTYVVHGRMNTLRKQSTLTPTRATRRDNDGSPHLITMSPKIHSHPTQNAPVSKSYPPPSRHRSAQPQPQNSAMLSPTPLPLDGYACCVRRMAHSLDCSSREGAIDMTDLSIISRTSAGVSGIDVSAGTSYSYVSSSGFDN